MNRHFLCALLAAVVLCLATADASACAACFGKSDSKLAEGMNAGIMALLFVVGSVLATIAAFFAFIIRRAATHPLPIPTETLEPSNA